MVSRILARVSRFRAVATATTLKDFFQSTTKQARMADPTQRVNLDEEVPPSTDPVVETAEYAMQLVQSFFCSVVVIAIII